MRRPIIVAVILCAGTSTGSAHEFAPALLELVETDGGRVAVTWKLPGAGEVSSDAELVPVLPEQCVDTSMREARHVQGGRLFQWTMRCRSELGGGSVGVDGLNERNAEALVRVELRDGGVFNHVLRRESSSVALPRHPTAWGVARTYVVLGIEHILTGFDHLLFVLALFLLLGDRRTLLAAVTAFTVGHSITLAMATLGVGSLPVAPTEAAIALSVLLIVVEVVRGRTDTLTVLHPWLVAFAFGLLHGFGFAGALTEMGLPSGELPLALLTFNLGVELGQITFLAVAALAIRLPAAKWALRVRAATYPMGIIAAWWAVERSASLLPLLGA